MAHDVRKLIKYAKGGILSKVLSKDGLNVTLFCMAKGTSISDHTATRHALVYVIEGKGVFVLQGKRITMSPGIVITMAPDAVHSLKAAQDTSFLLVMK